MSELNSHIRRRVQELTNEPKKLLLFAGINYLTCTGVYMAVEDKGPIESAWWTIVTGFTVGYGDMYPTTTAGRLVALVVMLTSWLILSILLVHIINDSMPDPHLFTDEEQKNFMSLLGALLVQTQLIYQLIVNNHRAKMAVLMRIEDEQQRQATLLARQEVFNKALANRLGGMPDLGNADTATSNFTKHV